METSQREPSRNGSFLRQNEEPQEETSAEQADVVYKGWLLLMTTGFRTSNKEVYVVLHMNRLIIYKDITNYEVSKNF